MFGSIGSREPDEKTLGEGLRGVSWTVARASYDKELTESAVRDGTAALPGVSDLVVSQFEQKIVLDAKQRLRNYREAMMAKDAVLYPDFVKARRDFQEAEKQYEEKKLELGGRPVHVEMSLWAYLLILVPITVAEVAVNQSTFATLFTNDSMLVAWVAAGTLGLVLLIAAHLLGSAIQQGKDKLMATVMTVVGMGMVLALGYFRFVNAETANSDPLSGLGGQVIKINPQYTAGFFIIFNLLFMLVAVWLSMRRHDSDATYEQRYKHYQKCRNHLVDMKKARDLNQREALGGARDDVGMFQSLITKYRDLNMQQRTMKVTPQVWLSNTPETLLAFDEQMFMLQDNESGLVRLSDTQR